MPPTILGLPAHPLVVHAVVVLVPLSALAGIVVAVWPKARERYAPLALGVATLALIAIPLATDTGGDLIHMIHVSAQVKQHAHMADGLLPFMIVLWVALAVLVANKWLPSLISWHRLVGVAAAVVVVLAAVGSAVQVARIGDSGARAAWHGVASSAHRATGPHH